MEKRSVKVEAQVRESVYGELSKVAIANSKNFGRTDEGQAFVTDEGVAYIVRVIIKKADFDAEYEVSDFALVQETKAKAKVDKAEKTAVKRAKGIADKAKAEVEKGV